MGTNPNLQCLFSGGDFMRIRLWVPCDGANGYESALLNGMDRMDGIRSEYEKSNQKYRLHRDNPFYRSRRRFLNPVHP